MTATIAGQRSAAHAEASVLMERLHAAVDALDADRFESIAAEVTTALASAAPDPDARVAHAPWCINVDHTDVGCDGQNCYQHPAPHVVTIRGGGRQRIEDSRVYPQLFLWPARELDGEHRPGVLTDDDLTTVKVALGHEDWDFEPVATMTLNEARAVAARLADCIRLAEQDAERLRSAGIGVQR